MKKTTESTRRVLTMLERLTPCAHCGAPLPGPYGTPGVSLARYDNRTLLCSDCGTREALSHAFGRWWS